MSQAIQALAILGVSLFGIDRLVLGCGGIARKFGVPIFLIGVTIAAILTSLPELAVSIKAAAAENSSLGISTAVGANIVNLGLILSVISLIGPAQEAPEGLEKTAFALLAMTVLFVSLLLDSFLSRIDGLVLVTGSVIVFVWLLRFETSQGPIVVSYDKEFGSDISIKSSSLNIALGLAALITGYLIFDRSAIFDWGRANDSSINQVVLGVVVFGLITSVPELLVGIVSVLRKEFNFALGMVIGSSVANISIAAGISMALEPVRVPPSMLSFHVFAMVAFVLVFFAMIWDYRGIKKKSLSKPEGAALLAAYAAFVIYAGNAI